MSGYFYRRHGKRDRDNYGGQNSGGGNYGQNYQNMGNMGSQQMMNPWQSGMMPALGAGSDEAALAFNILNQVLASDTPMGGSGHGQGDSFHNRKSRQMNIGDRLEDRRRGRSPQYSNRNRSDHGSRQWSGGRSRSPQRRNDYSNSSRRDDSDRKKPAKERLGNRQGEGHSSNDKRSQKEHTPTDKRRRSSDKERDRQSSEKPSSRGDSASRDKDDLEDKDTDDVKTDKKRKADPEYDAYISKCLKCHICEIDSFESVESFRDHKKSEEHKLLVDIFHERSEAALELMRADSKLAANRDREKSGVANKESFYTRCVKCHCIVADAFKTHSKSIEHELVDSYMFRECCGSSFNERKKYDEHRITIPHLKRDMEIKKDDAPDDKVVLAFTDEEKAAGDILYEFKQSHRFELDSPADFPDYDPEKPTGLGYVHKKRRYKCNVCKKSFPSYSNMALAHCRSFNHYLMLLAHLETKLPDVEDDGVIESDEKNEDDSEEKKSEKEMEVDADANDGKPESENKDEEEETKVVDEVKEEDKENDDENETENAEVDEEMGENLPPLEDGGIILEDVEKAADDDVEEEEEAEELEADEALVEEEAQEIERMSNDEESTPAPEESTPAPEESTPPEEEEKPEEPELEMETSEDTKEEETQDEATQEEVTQEVTQEEIIQDEATQDEAKDEEEEEVVEEEEEKVKPTRRQRARRGRGRSALRF